MDQNKTYLTNNQKRRCEEIIHSASVAAGGVGTGMAQIPLSDSAVIIPIQIAMIVGIGQVFGKEITRAAAGALATSQAAAFCGRSVSQVLLGWMPGLGNIVNAATAAALTEALGWFVVKEFAPKTSDKPIV